MPDNKILQFPGAARSAIAGRLLIPSRLKDARKVARLTQRELGDLVGVTPQSVSAYERGDKVPESGTFQKIANVLRQPVSYFTSIGSPVFGDFSTQFYRKSGPETVKRNEACSVLGRWFAQTARYLDNFITYPAVVLHEAEPDEPDGTYSTDKIDSVALALRAHWGLGAGPISNVLALLESNGVVICRYELRGDNVEAFSFWNGSRPFIFMGSDKESGARLRFDLAHELGHLVLHRCVEQSEIDDPIRLKIVESEANRFAGAFLLPKTSFPHEIYTLKLDAFIPLKKRWKVSIQSMVHRCKDLDIIDADQYLNLYKQISFRKWRKKEPLDDPRQIPLEQPNLLRRAMDLVLQNRKHPDEIANELHLSREWIEAFCNLPEGSLRAGLPAYLEPSLK